MNNAIKGKLLECETLIEQAVNNTKEQFANSPDLDARITDAVMDALSPSFPSHVLSHRSCGTALPMSGSPTLAPRRLTSRVAD